MTNHRRVFLAALSLPLAAAACSSGDKSSDARPADPARAPAGAPTQAPPPGTTTPSAPPLPTAAPADSPAASRTGMKFRFGIMPGNYDDDADGVEVGDVYDGTSAGEAGIKKGDRLMTWNGKKITTVENWMEHMAPHRAGDVVDVGVLRDGRVIPIKVTLKPAE
jgi:hypothetical protein